MKIKPTDKVKVQVKANSYQSNGIQNKLYYGSWESVLNKISSVHSYGWVVGYNDEVPMDCKDVLDSIVESNGDGCDYIFSMVVEKSNEKWTIIDQEEEVD